MREIKFRAWDGEIMHNDVTYTKDYTEGAKPWAFMQFTGLLDKSGKEIYEGDVVRHYDNEMWLYRIDMAELDYLVPLNDDANDHTGDMSPDALHGRPNNFQVIGNLYENPELLTESNERTVPNNPHQ